MDNVTFEIIDGVAVLRSHAHFDVAAGVQVVREAIERAVAAGVDKLLVDASRVDIRNPTVAERFSMVTDWATVGRGLLAVALVVSPLVFDTEQFGGTVAMNHGLRYRAFTDSAAALAWLQADTTGL